MVPDFKLLSKEEKAIKDIEEKHVARRSVNKVLCKNMKHKFWILFHCFASRVEISREFMSFLFPGFN